MNQSSSSKDESLTLWRNIYKEVGPKIGLSTPVKIKVADWWFFDEKPERKNIILNCPPHHEKWEGPFVHYLGHAKLLEDGWPRIVVSVGITEEQMKKLERLPEERRQKALLYWASRSEDSFFDFYVWQWIAQCIGHDYALPFFRGAVAQEPAKTVAALEQQIDSFKLPYNVYTWCLDWFGSYYQLAKQFDGKIAADLDILFDAVLKSQIIKKALPINLKDRINWVRNFYEASLKKYPNHLAFVDGGLQTTFITYYKKVWEGFDIEINITEWRQRR